MKKRRWPRIVGIVLLAGLAAFILWIEIWLKPVYPAFEQPHDSMAELQQALSGQAGLLFPDLSGLDLAEAAYFAEVDGRTRFAHRTGNYRIEAITDSSPQFRYAVRAVAGAELNLDAVEFYRGVGIAGLRQNESAGGYSISAHFLIGKWRYSLEGYVLKSDPNFLAADVESYYAEIGDTVWELCCGIIDQAVTDTARSLRP